MFSSQSICKAVPGGDSRPSALFANVSINIRTGYVIGVFQPLFVAEMQAHIMRHVLHRRKLFLEALFGWVSYYAVMYLSIFLYTFT